MKKIISLLLGSIVAITLSISAAFSAANEVRVAFFLELSLIHISEPTRPY